jgi:hypothetical protein
MATIKRLLDNILSSTAYVEGTYGMVKAAKVNRFFMGLGKECAEDEGIAH